MPGAGDSNRRIPSVFDKLNGVDNRLVDGERNLVYPRDLGEDEYNHFVLFTMYEKDSELTQQVQNTVSQVQQTIFIDNIKDIEDSADLLEIIGTIFSNAGESVASSVEALAEKGVELSGEVLSWVISKFSGLPEGVTDAYSQEAVGTAARGRVSNLAEQLKKSYASTTSRQYEQFKDAQSQSAVKRARNLGLDIKDVRSNPYYNRVRLSAATYKSPMNIALYIPQKLVNNGNITYNGVNFEIAQAAFGMLAGGDLSSAGPAVRRGLAGMMDQITGLVGAPVNATEAITAVTGLAINPREEQLFQGVQSRSFDMTFKLVPRSAEEAVEVSNIVRAFRRYSHPSVRAGSFFLALPAEFDIRYYRIDENGTAEENVFLNRIGRCALTSVGVDYSPSSVSSFFHDGSPVATALTLSFTEFRPLTREDIEEGF